MTPYETIRYPTSAREQSHPDRLATIATLHGLPAPPVERCRVLELGCGTGNNLIAMAYSLPGSTFTGIDLAAEPVAEGQGRIAALGLRNIRLLAMDLMDLEPAFGEFDYIVAHGVYSWVPAAVRDKLMEVCRANLSPHGVVFISYNALPGCHLRRMVRDMMLYHIAGVEEPEQRLQQALSLASLIGGAQTEAGLKAEFQVVLERPPAVVYHDDLSEENHPVYFHQFAGHAREHGLQFLSEAQVVASEAHLPDAARKVLEPLEGDSIRREQYLDFFKLRRFRETLLCRADAAVARPVAPDRVRALYASSKARPAGPEEPGGAVEFVGQKGAAAKTAHPLAKAMLTCLGRLWPRRLAFDELLGRVRESLGGAPGEQDAIALAEILWHTSRAGVVELHTWTGRFAAQPGEYPVASALARLDLRDGNTAPTLAHNVMEVEDRTARDLVLLLDGTRNRATLAVELDVPLPAIEEGLMRLARVPLLEA